MTEPVLNENFQPGHGEAGYNEHLAIHNEIARRLNNGAAILPDPLDESVYLDGSGGWSKPVVPPREWNPMLPPASPNVMDDEFNGQDAAHSPWIVLDEGESMLAHTGKNGLQLLDLEAEGQLLALLQPIPATSFTMWTRVSLSGDFAQADRCGLIFSEGTSAQKYFTTGLLTPNTADDHGVCQVVSEKWTDYSNLGEAASISKYCVPSIYLRARVFINEGAYLVYTEISTDGLSWQYAGGDMLEFTPDKIGLFVRRGTLNTGNNNYCVFSFWRVANAITDPLYGPMVMEGNR